MSGRRRSAKLQQASQGPSKLRFREALKPELEEGAIEAEVVEARRLESLAETRAYGPTGRKVQKSARGPSVVWCASCGKPILGVPGDTCSECSAPPPMHWTPEHQPQEATIPSIVERPLRTQPREALSRMGPTWQPPERSR
jgi:hypothetical protein